MASSGTLDYWRKFFRSAAGDIFELLEKAVAVAAIDCPDEFRARRDGIVEKIFTVGLQKCDGCDQIGNGSGARSSGVTEVEDGERSVKREVEKEGKVDCFDEDLQRGLSNYSYDEAEALTEEIEEHSQVYDEVLRIKDVLSNHQDMSDSALFESLRRLQLMELSVEVLKATEIGKTVNVLRKHNSKQIRHLVRTLIEGWKVLVDEWVRTTAAVADKTPDSTNVSVVEEEGLPSPPLDEGALFAAPTSIQLSQFFDGMDDDGNLRNAGEFDKKKENGSRLLENHQQPRKLQPLQKAFNTQYKMDARKHEPWLSTAYEEKGSTTSQEPFLRQPKLQQTIGETKTGHLDNKQNKLVIADSGPGKAQKPIIEHGSASESKTKQQRGALPPQMKLPVVPQNKTKYSNEISDQAKLELAKRKLQESYQQAENAKKQRTIQVMEIDAIPKKPLINKHPNLKFRGISRR